MIFFEKENAVPDDVMRQINHHVLTNANFPFYFRPTYTTKNFPFFSHTLMPRIELEDETPRTSEYFPFWNDIAVRFGYENGINITKMMRANVNATIHHPVPFSEPHVDYTENHYVVIIYLNDCDGDTIIFDKTYDTGPTYLSVEDGLELGIVKRVTPKAGKILLFDGKYFHTNEFPSPGHFRFICAFLCS